jgi:hypothetical protein
MMLLGAVVAYLLFKAGRRIVAPKPTVEKLKTYACGEVLKPEEIHVDSEQFYSPIRRVLRPFYSYVRPEHAGVLSTYLFWVVVGFIIILIAIMVALG